ncbi:MAG: tetratricopeptide repeat protein [Gemmatimonadaceae bacterium]
MTHSVLDDPLLQQARARAAEGGWREVAALLADAPASPAERPERATLYAEALIRTGTPQRARAFLDDAVPVLSRSAHRVAHRTALNLRGVASFAIGALDDAQAAWDEALELAQRGDDPLLVARTTNNLGAIANLRGAADHALSLYQLAVPLYQRLGELRGLAETYHNLAITHRDLGDLARADDHEQRAIEFARQAGADHLVVMARVGRAKLALLAGDHPVAAARALAAARAPGADDFRGTRGDALRCAGEAYTALGRHDEARALLDEAMAIAVATGQALEQAETLLASARLAWHAQARDRALRDARAAAEAFERLGAARELAEARALLERMRG